MKIHRKRRLYFILLITLGLSAGVGLVFYALGQNVNLYYTPTQISQGKIPRGHSFRIGGVVKSGTIERIDNTLQVHFALTDFQNTIIVHYTGILPALFRENQGVVVQGRFDNNGNFIAEEVLAKHDEKYMPPGIQLSSKHGT